MNRARYFQILVPCVTIVVFLFAVELGFRFLVFSNLPGAPTFRNPDLYANYFSDDDYWLLYHHFNGQFKPPEVAHPTLGWVGSFDRSSLIHEHASQLGNRRPVLLYGDSFAACAEPPCFQDVLNHDQEFSQKCFLMDYGVGGYGLDQIFLLMAHTVGLYGDPIVVFSLLTEDIDRNVLSVRVGQKPRFRLEDGQLRLANVPIENNPSDFFAKTNPRIQSYLFRLALYGRVLPDGLARRLRRDEQKQAEKIDLARAILKEAVAQLRQRKLDFSFLVFVGHWKGISSIDEDSDWRLKTILDVLEAEGAAYINSKEVLREDMSRTGHTAEKYFIPGDGHYNGDTNALLAARLQLALGACH